MAPPRVAGGRGLLLLLAVLAALCFAVANAAVSYDHRSLVINGRRRILISGSIHYPRSTPEMWPGLIQKAKDGGLDVVQTYVFWNGHEPRKRQYNFEGKYNIRHPPHRPLHLRRMELRRSAGLAA